LHSEDLGLVAIENTKRLKKSVGAEETVVNPNIKRLSMVGKEIKVKSGPYKQHKGIIKKDYGDKVQIELTSKQKCVILSESELMEVSGDSEDPTNTLE